MLYYKKYFILLIAFLLALPVFSNDINIRISESDMQQSLSSVKNAPKPDIEGSITYIESDQRYNVDLKNPKDIEKLATSTEFEIYKINENGTIHTVFESPAGICYGLNSNKIGVDVTDSSNIYLVAGDEKQYYGNVIGATLYDAEPAKNVQYVPVYVIHNPVIAKHIHEKNEQNSKYIVMKNIEKNLIILSNIVCQQKK